MHTLRATFTGKKGFGVAGDNLALVVPLILKRTGLRSLVKGTLNLSLKAPYIVMADAVITGKEYFSGETIKLQRCLVRGIRALIMRPDTHENTPPFGHGPAHLELLSEYHLTSELGLSPGSIVDVEVEGDEAWWQSGR